MKKTTIKMVLLWTTLFGLELAALAQNPCNDPQAECSPVIVEFIGFLDCSTASSTVCCTHKSYRYKCSGDTNWRYITHKYAEQDSECLPDIFLPGHTPPYDDGIKDCVHFNEQGGS